jgi:hypothetical protein
MQGEFWLRILQLALECRDTVRSVWLCHDTYWMRDFYKDKRRYMKGRLARDRISLALYVPCVGKKLHH